MKRLLTILSILIPLATVAQTNLIPDMKFKRLDTRDGLSSSQINCVFKDSKGYVWFGTAYGLNRYDGYRIKTYYSNMRDTTSMRDNYTDQIYEAYDGKLWLKQGMNYCVYDPVSDRFERNAMRELGKIGLSGGLERLYIDSKKCLWVKFYEQGLYYYNPKTKTKHQFKLGYEKNELNPTYGISWFAEQGQKMLITTNCGDIICVDGERGTIDWENKWMREHGGPENQNYELTIDKDGNYYVVTRDHTFIYMKQENRWYSTFNELMEAKGFSELPENLLVWGIAFDHHGWMWAIADHEGVLVIDMKARQMKQFKSSKYDLSTISDNTPRHLYSAPDGSMWIGTYKNGVNQYLEAMSSIKSIELGDINTVCEDRHGNYWIGTNDQGILVYDPRTGETKSHFTQQNSGLSGNIMVGSWPASDGSIWFGSYNGGLIRCIPSAANPTEATIVNYRSTGAEDGLADNNVWGLTEDKWNRIWLTTLGGGVQMLDLKTGKFKTWNTKNTSLPSDYLNSINWTKKGWIMVGTSYYYSLLNPVSGQLVSQTLPEDPSITVNISSTSCIMEDSRGLIWQGSTSGVTLFDPKTKYMELIDMTKGLYGSSITSIAEDRQHTMWVCTDHGVSRIKLKKQNDGTWQHIIRSFNSSDGLQTGTYNQRSTWITRDGLLLVGGQGGLDIINPAKVVNTSSKEKPLFSGLQLFDQDVAVGTKIDGRTVLDETLNECREITLNFNDQFTIQLGSDAGNINNTKRFAYQLEGFNDNWVRTSQQNPNITYNSLRPGSYTLHVRMLNEDGTLGVEESTLDITIVPPLWRTRWAILLYILIVAALALLWRRWFLKRHTERTELERLRQEMEKRQWMSQMQHQAAEEDEQQPISPLTLRENDLVEVLSDVCKNFKSQQHNKRVKISFYSNTDELETAFDEERIRESLEILLNNSVKFSLRDSKIKVSVNEMDDKAVIRISDNSIGLPEDALPHLFAPTSDKDDGIQLHIVKDIITAHHGTINAENNPGGGTLFTIELPIDNDVEEAEILD